MRFQLRDVSGVSGGSDSETCDAPSPGGGLRCIRAPHATGGHVFEHPSVGGDRKERTPKYKTYNIL